MDTLQAIYDRRPITELCGIERGWYVGQDGVTRITPYLESDGTNWFAIYEGDHLAFKVPALAVQYIWYNKEKTDGLQTRESDSESAGELPSKG